MQRVDIVRDERTGKEMVVSSVDLADTVQGEISKDVLMISSLLCVCVCLALGPRYQAEDFQIQSVFPLETFSSGLQSKERFSPVDRSLSFSG